MHSKAICGLAAAVLLLSACGDSGGDGGGASPPAPSPPAVNSPPTANAGADQLVLTARTVNLAGSGTDSDGSIATMAWTQSGGTPVTLTGANTATPSFTSPAAAGTLTFDFSVTDNSGATRSDSVSVVVNAPPVATAGADLNVANGASVTLTGSGADANGTIASYAWTQTSGPAITLSNAASASSTFTAPTGPATLNFDFTVTDNQGATHTDSLVVTVYALNAPVILRNPGNVRALENGSAMLFVVASGENLSYEWNYASGVLAKSASPEPWLMRGADGIDMRSNGDCFRVTVSNAAGSVTSEPGCITVLEAEGNFDPSDDILVDDWGFAQFYGNVVLEIVRESAGPLTGGYPGTSMVPRLMGPGKSCLGGGSYLGATLDGAILTQGAAMPLGKHRISHQYVECENGDPDEPSTMRGGLMIEYDFPSTFGVGTFTLYFSGWGEDYLVKSGILRVTTSRGVSASGYPTDETVIVVDDDFSVADGRTGSTFSHTIELERRANMAETIVTDSTLKFDLMVSAGDEDGHVGTMGRHTGSSSEIAFHWAQDTSGEEESSIHTSEGEIVVGLGTGQLASGTYVLGTIKATYGQDWHFVVVPPEPHDPVAE